MTRGQVACRDLPSRHSRRSGQLVGGTMPAAFACSFLCHTELGTTAGTPFVGGGAKTSDPPAALAVIEIGRPGTNAPPQRSGVAPLPPVGVSVSSPSPYATDPDTVVVASFWSHAVIVNVVGCSASSTTFAPANAVES